MSCFNDSFINMDWTASAGVNHVFLVSMIHHLDRILPTDCSPPSLPVSSGTAMSGGQWSPLLMRVLVRDTIFTFHISAHALPLTYTVELPSPHPTRLRSTPKFTEVWMVLCLPWAYYFTNPRNIDCLPIFFRTINTPKWLLKTRFLVYPAGVFNNSIGGFRVITRAKSYKVKGDQRKFHFLIICSSFSSEKAPPPPRSMTFKGQNPSSTLSSHFQWHYGWLLLQNWIQVGQYTALAFLAWRNMLWKIGGGGGDRVEKFTLICFR